MAKQKDNQDKNMLYAAIVLMLVLVLFWALRVGMKNYPSHQPGEMMTKEVNPQPEINDSSDLNKALNDLNSNNLDEIDSGLNSINTDSSSF